MTTYHTGADTLSVPPTWVRVLLGIVLILAGLFVLGDVAMATLISTVFIAIVAIVAGAFEIAHAFWTKGWGAFIWQIVLGVLYIAFGLVLLNRPVAGALALTYALGLLLFASGLVRIFLSFKYWSEGGWIMLISGIIGVLAGLVILAGWPVTGLWVLGFLLGIDLISHGIAWLAYGWLMPAARTA
jgi:uncharacterized membrane protein HdeD (DUF308 family)